MVIDSQRIRGHYLPVISMVLGKGGRDDHGAGIFWRVLGLHWEAAIAESDFTKAQRAGSSRRVVWGTVFSELTSAECKCSHSKKCLHHDSRFFSLSPEAWKPHISSCLVTSYRFPGSSMAFKNLDWSSGSFRSRIPQINLPFQKRSTSPW